MLTALGWRFLDADGVIVDPSGLGLAARPRLLAAPASRRSSGTICSPLVVAASTIAVASRRAMEGSLTAREVAAALAEGIRAVVPRAQVRELPLADGSDRLVGDVGLGLGLRAGQCLDDRLRDLVRRARAADVAGQVVHGSAPDIAGQRISNPIGAIASAALMLDQFGLSNHPGPRGCRR
jgi:hypothetical protein